MARRRRRPGQVSVTKKPIHGQASLLEVAPAAVISNPAGTAITPSVASRWGGRVASVSAKVRNRRISNGMRTPSRLASNARPSLQCARTLTRSRPFRCLTRTLVRKSSSQPCSSSSCRRSSGLHDSCATASGTRTVATIPPRRRHRSLLLTERNYTGWRRFRQCMTIGKRCPAARRTGAIAATRSGVTSMAAKSAVFTTTPNTRFAEARSWPETKSLETARRLLTGVDPD